MTKSLRDEFPEYNGDIEFEEMNILVKGCCFELLEALNKPEPSEETPAEAPKETQKVSVSFKFRDIEFKRFMEPADSEVKLFNVYSDSFLSKST